MNGFDNSANDPAGTTPGPHATDPYAGSPASSPNDPYTAPGYSYAPGYGASAPVPPPAGAGLPNPGLATFLGFIPGVGAMYNGQFAKGLAHIVIFAVLVSLADHVNGIFGLLVTGWIFYMVFDAYQTARARRDGLQIPDPFGLNNIGERLGVGNGPNWSDFTARPAPGQAPPPPAAQGYAPGPQSAPYTPPATPYDAAAAAYQDAPPSYPPAPASPAYQQGYSGYAPYGVPAAAVPPYGAPPYATPPSPPFSTYVPPPLPSANGVPTGALWLIGLGVFALVGTMSHRFYWSNRFLDGAIVIAIGVAILITRLLRARNVYPAGSAAATWYMLRSTRAGLILIAIGITLTIDHVSSIGWSDMWPYLLILLGVFLLLERATHNRMLADGPIPPANTAPAVDPYAPAQPDNSSFVPPAQPRDEEGR